MKSSNHETGRCPSQALKLLGDYVTLHVIDTLRKEELRFRELLGAMDNVNQVTLTRRLKLMEEAGILSRHEETIDKQSVTYRLTDMGLGLLPILYDIKAFTEQFTIAKSS